MALTKVAKSGGLRYPSGAIYVGDFSPEGLRTGLGHLVLADGTRYDGRFENGVCEGLGVLCFPDGAKYEGEFMCGWFHGVGIFWRADGTRFEGEFRGGRMWGLGLATYSEGSHGFPRHEGHFQNGRLLRRRRCPEVIQRAHKIALMARMNITS